MLAAPVGAAQTVRASLRRAEPPPQFGVEVVLRQQVRSIRRMRVWQDGARPESAFARLMRSAHLLERCVPRRPV